MQNQLRDFQRALRGLLRTPAFTLIAVLTLGLGIGANTAIFAVVNTVLLRPLALPQPNRLVAIRERDHTFPSMSVSYPDFLDWRQESHGFSALGVSRYTQATLTRAGAPEVLTGFDATASWFQALDATPELGRAYTSAEDQLGAGRVVVIADSLWRQRFGANRQVIGQAIELDGEPYTVVGVMPATFSAVWGSGAGPQFFRPVGPRATAASGLTERGNHPGFEAIGRLKPGVSRAAALSNLSAIAAALAVKYPDSNTGVGIHAEPLLESIVGNTRASLWLMLLAVGMVLLIACGNLANLLLARVAARARANAIRAALGATRRRLIGEQMSESVCLGLAGGAVGWGLAWLCVRAAPALWANSIPRAGQIGMSGAVPAFTVGAALITALLFGWAPAWHASRVEIGAVLKEGGREAPSGARGQRLRSVLVGMEMGLALLLLAGAGLLIRSLAAMEQAPLGFRPDYALSFEVSLPLVKYPGLKQEAWFFARANDRLAALPGVIATGGVNPLPFGQGDWESGFRIVGQPKPAPGHEPSADSAIVAGNYFQAAGIRLLSGRVFRADDSVTSPPVAIVDESFARRYFPDPDPNRSALGRQVHWLGTDRQIVGVVNHVRYYGYEETPRVEIYAPLAQAGASMTTLHYVVRTRFADPMRLRTSAVAQIQAMDPDLPVDDVRTMDQRVEASLARRRLGLGLMGAFALLALALAAIGIYGVLSYAVAQRSHEMGVRMALGASRGRILAMVLGQGLRLAAIGAACGLAAALALGRFASSFLYGVAGADAVTLTAVSLLLLAVAGLACYLPARRATRISPSSALRGAG